MWVPLHVHSQFSILDATASISGIVKKSVEFGLPAVALTDHGNMHGAIDFYKACKAEKIKPILGCEVYVAPDSRFDKKKGGPSQRAAYHLTLLAKDQEGYRNLCQLSSLGYLEGFYYHPRIDKELLKKHAKGLICLSGCLSGLVAQTLLHGGRAEFLEEVKWLQELFGEDFYLELQRHQMESAEVNRLGEVWLLQQYQEYIEKQERVNKALIELAREHSLPCVATNDSHYIEPEEWQAHEILLNIASGEPCEIWETNAFGENKFRVPNAKRRTYSTREVYFKSPAQMQALFADVPEAISNSLLIAEKCHLSLDFNAKHYPVYFPPGFDKARHSSEERAAAAEEFLRTLCREGVPLRYTPERLAKVQEKYPHEDPQEVVEKRLHYELEIITTKGMCDYLLIVWDFINWAKKEGIPVGPGRGSGAGSIVLYLIGVTDIEPLRFHLFFERFINPERISYPDIDVDICMERRNRVLEYTLAKYGKENVAQIVTFGTMKARMAVKDVGRVLSVPLPKVNIIAKLIPEELNITLAKALEIDADLVSMVQSDEDTRRVIELGQRLEGSVRNTGIHAAGVIVSGSPLMEHIPLCVAKDSELAVTQYSMKPLEAVGMLKIDFLGLKTLTGIKICVEEIAKSQGKELDWVNLPLENEATFKLLQEGRTLGVFQMESGGMQELAKQLHPDKFEEIIAMGALYRPGPMEMIPSFVNRKHGREVIEYDHPWLEPILAETYGIMVYQEQVMQIASRLAKYTLGEGDVLRKAMGKKDVLQMAQEREKFRAGAMENGLSGELATTVFDKVEKFASYGFNKSHAAAYGYLTYVTAFLKANYPSEWMAALMTCDRDDISKVAKFIRECQALDIPILPPDVNEAAKEFVATSSGIRFAMTGIKGVGEGAVEAILEERERGGPFLTFYEFFKRIDLKKVGKKAIEHLVDAGSFDFTGWSRDQLRLSVEQMFDAAQREKKEAASGILTLFDLMGQGEKERFTTPPPVKEPLTKFEILRREKELLGFFLTGHPLQAYTTLIKRLGCLPSIDLDSRAHNTVLRSALLIESLYIRISQKSQRKFAILTVSDGLESYELPIWSDLFEEKQALLIENQLLFTIVQIEKREEGSRLSCRWLEDLTKMSDQMITLADQAYDRAKQQAERGPSRFFAFKERKEESSVKPLQLHLNLDQVRLSSILKLKQLLVRYPGKHPVHLLFMSGKATQGTLFLGEQLSVQPRPELQAEIDRLLQTSGY